MKKLIEYLKTNFKVIIATILLICAAIFLIPIKNHIEEKQKYAYTVDNVIMAYKVNQELEYIQLPKEKIKDFRTNLLSGSFMNRSDTRTFNNNDFLFYIDIKSMDGNHIQYNCYKSEPSVFYATFKDRAIYNPELFNELFKYLPELVKEKINNFAKA